MSTALHMHRGFTLVELVIVIAITGIIAAIIAVFIRQPVEGYMDLTRRAELVDAAESALRLMARDIRRALPNSIRITGNNTQIEMINTVQGARYRAAPPGDDDRVLDFNTSDNSFNVFGQALPTGTHANHYLSIYNLGVADADAYNLDPVITPAETITITNDTAPSNPNEQTVTLSSGHQFAFQSPRQRVFLVDGAISYRCEGTALNRYGVYAIGGNAGTGTPVTRHVAGCNFTYTAGTATRAGLVTLELTLTDGGESVRLLHQVHVDNVP